MAETVVKKMNERQAKEDKTIQSYIKQKELDTLFQEEQKRKNNLQSKEEMKATLNQQMKEREG